MNSADKNQQGQADRTGKNNEITKFTYHSFVDTLNICDISEGAEETSVKDKRGLKETYKLPVVLAPENIFRS